MPTRPNIVTSTLDRGPFLLDTMVLSEGFKVRPDPAAYRWLNAYRHQDTAYLSVITIGEVARGVRRLEMTEKRRPDRYIDWLEATVVVYDKRVLPLTIGTARRWGQLSHDLRNTNPDLLIAATALEHDLTIVTRNVRHIEPTGVKLLNPYET
ncbi:MAG: type II toxin-antitoxin system VapC family toxin [Rhizobiaceae bacterium]|nr:type II toxin-antitoxin system VapC family toxin [Rhizobiaceae bacterium]